jgi:hypothetical protein
VLARLTVACVLLVFVYLVYYIALVYHAYDSDSEFESESECESEFGRVEHYRRFPLVYFPKKVISAEQQRKGFCCMNTARFSVCYWLVVKIAS